MIERLHMPTLLVLFLGIAASLLSGNFDTL